MIGNVGGGNPMVAFLQARTATARPAKGASKSDREAEIAKAADEQRRRTDDLLRMLTQLNTDVTRERKAAAAEKVDRLKKELEILRLFSGSNPKAIAREAARIARELGAAAAEYSSAGGGTAVGGAAPGASAGDANAAVSGVADAEGGVSGAQAGASAEGSADKGVEAPAAAAEKVAADAGATPPGTEQHTKTEEDKSDKPSNPEEKRAAFVAQINQAIGESQSRAGEAAADQKFANDVRYLFNQAKALVEQQRRRAADENRDDGEFEQFSRNVEAAGDAIEQAFSSGGMDTGFAMVQAPVNITM